MNPEKKALWVAALRSGEYRQGKGKLRMEAAEQGEYQYCCLGVLCDLASRQGMGRWDRWYGEGTFIARDERSWAALPSAVAEWAGITDAEGYLDPAFGPPGDREALATANDDGGATFEEIADLIEQYL